MEFSVGGGEDFGGEVGRRRRSLVQEVGRILVRGWGGGVWCWRWGGFLWVDGEAKEEFGVGGGEEPIGSCGATAHLL